MAAAEARAVWQRTANRCFVQEDARRAPKLACCQSSSALKQADAEPAAAPADRLDQPAAGFAPLNRNPSYSNAPSDTRWWLHLQPNYGYRMGFTFEQINALENDDGTAKAGFLNSASHKRKEAVSDLDRNSDSFCGENYSTKKIAGNVRGFIELEDSMDGWEMLQMDNKKPNEMCFDTEYSWVGSERSEPWWRMADKDELVSLVSRKAHDHVENCDLPPPQKICLRRGSRPCVGCFNSEKILESSLDWKAQTGLLSTGTVLSQGFANSGRTQEKIGFDESSSYRNTVEIFSSKAELMEALHHSQTRARKAEKAAKSAYAEKDHIVTLFFRQASLLFAYKQWLQLLQLETLYAQFKNDDDKQISSLFPLALPWMSTNCKDGRPRKSSDKGVKSNGEERREQVSHDVTKYSVALALGLSLVGAGLLLGWTVGWMFPRL